MIIRNIFILLCLLAISPSLRAQDSLELIESIEIQIIKTDLPDTLAKIETPSNTFKYRESKRFVAAVLCLALGPFGMHRLYLGTSPKVAAAYSVTLGGIGIIPAIDFLLITFSKDISRFKENERVIMWVK